MIFGKIMCVGDIILKRNDFEILFFFHSITSSEKVDKENRYADFCILSIPYPGTQNDLI